MRVEGIAFHCWDTARFWWQSFPWATGHEEEACSCTPQLPRLPPSASAAISSYPLELGYSPLRMCRSADTPVCSRNRARNLRTGSHARSHVPPPSLLRSCEEARTESRSAWNSRSCPPRICACCSSWKDSSSFFEERQVLRRNFCVSNSQPTVLLYIASTSTSSSSRSCSSSWCCSWISFNSCTNPPWFFFFFLSTTIPDQSFASSPPKSSWYVQESTNTWWEICTQIENPFWELELSTQNFSKPKTLQHYHHHHHHQNLQSILFLNSNNSLFISILLYRLPWLHRHGEKATTNITTHHPKIHNQNGNTYQKQNISSQPITQKNLNQNKNTSKAEHFFHHHSPAKFSNST